MNLYSSFFRQLFHRQFAASKRDPAIELTLYIIFRVLVLLHFLPIYNRLPLFAPVSFSLCFHPHSWIHVTVTSQQTDLKLTFFTFRSCSVSRRSEKKYPKQPDREREKHAGWFVTFTEALLVLWKVTTKKWGSGVASRLSSLVTSGKKVFLFPLFVGKIPHLNIYISILASGLPSKNIVRPSRTRDDFYPFRRTHPIGRLHPRSGTFHVVHIAWFLNS